MKLASHKEYDSRKRLITLICLVAIGAAHLLIFGGGYLASRSAEGAEGPRHARAGANGLGTWSSQGPRASEANVDPSAATLFDRRAGDLRGYNAGDTLFASAATGGSASRSGRFAPRRPTDEAPSGPARDDEVLQPISGPGSEGPTRESSGSSDLVDYTVQIGDSLWSIGKRFDVAVPILVAANPGVRADSIRVGQVLRVPRMNADDSEGGAESQLQANLGPSAASRDPGSVYVVKSGDSLSRIAVKQGVTVAELRAANGLRGDVIRVGQELRLPSSSRASTAELVGRQHIGAQVKVEPGDTLEKIAAVHRVSVSELVAMNDIKDPRFIRIGQIIRIPDTGRAAPAAAAATQPTRQPARTTPAPMPTPPPASEQRPAATEAERRVVTPPPALPSLDSLESDEPSLPTLDALEEDAFMEDDLDEQPLVPIRD